MIEKGRSIGRYHILEQLGQGGMATVYKAFDTRLDSDVAVKVIRVDMFPPAAFKRVRKRFEREAKSLAKLNHPNIVNVIDYGEYEGAPYLVMKYMPGGTLKDQLGNPYSYAEAAWILAPIARALAYAHQQGILHRDVKPANILITQSGEPILTDFGIAKLLEEGSGQTLTGTGVGVGTPEYMAPEQGWGVDLDGRADVYSLGVVLYELLTGRKPFYADTPLAVLYKQMNDPLPRLIGKNSKIPEKAEHVVFKAMAKKPENRYGDMGEFAEALEKLAKDKNTKIANKTIFINNMHTGEETTSDELSISRDSGISKSKINISDKKFPNWIWLIIGVLTFAFAIGIAKPWEQKIPELSTPVITQTVQSSIESEFNENQNPTMVYEDFNDGKLNLVGHSTDSDSWKIVTDNDGNKVFQVDNLKNGEFVGFSFGEADWKNYSVEYKLKFLQSDGSMGLHVRDDGDKFNVIELSPSGEIYLASATSSEWVRTQTKIVSIETNIWYNVKVIVNHDTIKIFLDDLLWINGNSTSENGYVMLSASPGAFFQIDDIKVLELQAIVLETKEDQLKTRCGSEFVTELLSEYNIVYFNNFSNGLQDIESWGADLMLEDGILINTGHGEWKSVTRADYIKSGKGFLIRFRFSPSTFFHVYIEQGEYGKDSHRVWGFSGKNNLLIPEAYYGAGFDGINLDWQRNDFSFDSDWACAFLTIDGAKYSTRVWNPKNPQQIAIITEDLGNDWENFDGFSGFATEHGVLEVDTYSELAKKIR